MLGRVLCGRLPTSLLEKEIYASSRWNFGGVLHLFHRPVPDDTDGRVLEELFDPSFMAQNSVRKCRSDDTDAPVGEYSTEETAIVQRLKNPG
ncbi:MAG: hypothetical protein DMG96_24510 [Acidobacteria bacterium]|nr:MAG: hypothetical protein DMG96_24510 [Acidobacteriota bacterium]